MATYSYTSNGIQFTNLNSSPSPKFSIGGKIFSGQNDFEYANEDGIKPVVNAVEIDWNGGVLPNGDIENGSSVTINTTGDLLSLINKMQEEIYVLSAAVVALSAKVG